MSKKNANKGLFIFDEKERIAANAMNSGISNTSTKSDGEEKLFGEIQNFQQTKIIQLENLFFLGHTSEMMTPSWLSEKNEQTIGGFKPKDFAQSLANKCPKKDNLKKVYLIGCEAGFINDDLNDCLAQKIADELYKQGFINVTIHAMTNPIDAPKAGMRVRIISNPGITQAYGVNVGDIQSISYSRVQVQQEEKGIVDKMHKPYSSIQRSQLIDEWNRPVNTFTPNQLPNKKLTLAKIAEQEKIIYRIDQAIKQQKLEGKKSTDKLLTNLYGLRHGLANTINYKQLLKDEIESYKKISKKLNNSSYLNLLKEIQKELNNKASIRFFKTSYQPNTCDLLVGLQTITDMELKIDEALINIQRHQAEYNPTIVNFIEANKAVNTLFLKAKALENDGSDESRLKARGIRLILEEAKLITNFSELNDYLNGIKNANHSTQEVGSASFYQKTLNRPRGIIDKILQFFGWEVTTETALLFDTLLEAVANRLAVENRLGI